MGRAARIGPGEQHLIPAYSPDPHKDAYRSARRKNSASAQRKRKVRRGKLLTQHTGLPPREHD